MFSRLSSIIVLVKCVLAVARDIILFENLTLLLTLFFYRISIRA